MGKADNQRLPVAQQSHGSSVSRSFCRRCSMGVYKLFRVKCALVLILTVAAFVSALFWVLPIRYRQVGFDVKESIKLSAKVQAYFKVQKPVSKLVPYIARLEYDINEEIGVPSLKVAVLSMHKTGLFNLTSLSNSTFVVFGFVPDPINSKVNSVSLSFLKSSLIDLFLQQYNLTLTSSIFGEPSSFEILRFPGGVTIIPEQAALISQSLFNFTLNSSIYDIKENLPELKEQLKLGLHLMPNEVVYIKVTNKHGSTKDPPVTVEASVASDQGPVLPERLEQLAQVITGTPPTENLGLDHSVFGKVKQISLSSFLNHSLQAPTPCPSPSPAQIYDTGPSMSPSYSPYHSPNPYHSPPPSAPSPENLHHHSSSPISDSPTPPLPAVIYGSQGPEGRGGKRSLSPPHVSSSATSSHSSFVAGFQGIQGLYSIGLMTFLLLFWTS